MRRRILLMVSSIGLGHAARSRAIAEALRARGCDVDVIAPPPALDYMASWGWRIHPVSYELEPINPIVNRYYEAGGSGAISLRLALEEHGVAKRNAAVIEAEVDPGGYDVIVADESWELMESSWLRYRRAEGIVLVTDFIYYPPSPRRLAAALAFNRFIDRRLPHFDLILFTGFPEKIPSESRLPAPLRWLAARAPRGMGISVIGPVPPIRPGELLDRGAARRELGIPEKGLAVLVSMGGTAAGRRELLGALGDLAALGFDHVVLAPGPSSLADLPEGVIQLGESLRYRIPALIKAFDLVLSNAGLSTIALMASAGVPGVISPISGHFEQEENALLASRRWRFIVPLQEGLRASVDKAVNSVAEADEGLLRNADEAAEAILGVVA